MKQAKLMLATIAVFAIIGGVYASKAKRGNQFIYTREATTTACTSKVLFLTLAENPLPKGLTTATDVFGQPCVLNIPYFEGN